jgi:hypothetical protein
VNRRDKRERERARHARQREDAGPEGLAIVVTLHALREQLKRCGYGHELTFGQVQRAVLAALVNGRLSKQLPTWIDPSSHREADEGHFFVWPDDCSRVFVVDLRQPRTIVVKTCMANPPVNSALRSELARWARAQGQGDA